LPDGIGDIEGVVRSVDDDDVDVALKESQEDVLDDAVESEGTGLRDTEQARQKDRRHCTCSLALPFRFLRSFSLNSTSAKRRSNN
jgi:hypothetical protein